MKALVLEKYNSLAYKDVPDPKCGTGQVPVAVKACGICGSDVHGMDGCSPVIAGSLTDAVSSSLGWAWWTSMP